MAKLIEPNPQVTAILNKVIKDTEKSWRSTPSNGWTLEKVLAEPLPTTEIYLGHCPVIDLTREDGVVEAVEEARKILGATTCTNRIVYPPHSYMKWHTNGDSVGIRTYYCFSAKPGSFVYLNKETGEKVISHEKVGWTCRQFEVIQDDPLWHCVYSEGVRFAFGFRTVREGS